MRISGSSYINVAPLGAFRVQGRVGQTDRSESVRPTGEAAPSKNTTGQSEDLQLVREVQALKDRDREVRTHEQAHLSAAGGLALSGAHFQYTTGPDGQRYAVGGDVSIDISEVPGDPEATIRKAETIRRAALAPAEPSEQDYRVAARASEMANKARVELFKSNQNGGPNGILLDVTA
ncbi:MAG: putative metalloprotease CJM1_0395 family protein [Gammaproteobacteria bacterium]